MTDEMLGSDTAVLGLLRRRNSLTVVELAELMEVTATAVRQRLTRLMAQGLIQRKATKEGRGRPSHHYELTPEGRRKTGSNFTDLAMVLWEEVSEIKDPEVRRGLLQRISKRLSAICSERISCEGGISERMDAVVDFFRERQIPFEVDRTDPVLPVLNVLACPYPGLAEQDRSVCSMERLMFSELLGENVRLSQCRLDGGTCCSFVPSGG